MLRRMRHLLSEGASMLALLTKDEPMDGKDRSSKMSALIDEGKLKRRCVECAIQSGEPGVRNARYGLRGVRGGGQPPRSHTYA